MNKIIELRSQFLYNDAKYTRIEDKDVIIWFPNNELIIFTYYAKTNAWYDNTDHEEKVMRENPPIIEILYQQALKVLPVKDDKDYSHLLTGDELGLI